MNITPPNNRLTRLDGGSMTPFIDRGPARLGTRPAVRNDDRPPVPGLRLGHVHLRVRDLARSLPFYFGILGLQLTERAGRYAFLSVGSEHHSLALEEVGDGAARPLRHALGIAHFAFEVADREAFVAMRQKLSRGGVPFISRNNGISWTVRFKDPDGNEIEIYVDRRRAPGGAARWGGRWHGPLRIERQDPSALTVAA